MIQLLQGDILNSTAEAIVNTVNCVGVMGKGIALQFKMKYPLNYRIYKKTCDEGKMLIGNILVCELNSLENPKYIFNFPTKRHWKTQSKIEDISKGLDSLLLEINRLKIQSIAIPALGCGLGGLKWSQVKKLIIDRFSELTNIVVELYEPNFKPSLQLAVNTIKPKLTLTKALLVKLLQVYQQLGYPHSQLEVQKLMYFMDVSLALKLNLQFIKSQYGPYANKINYLLQDMENHYTRGYGDRSQRSEIRLMESAISEADMFLLNHGEYTDNINKIARLVDGFETPFGMELLATVHWIVKHECNQSYSCQEVITKIHQWSERKKSLFQPNHIEIALEHLSKEHWIN